MLHARDIESIAGYDALANAQYKRYGNGSVGFHRWLALNGFIARLHNSDAVQRRKFFDHRLKDALSATYDMSQNGSCLSQLPIMPILISE
jgi:hypothetical protein